MNSRRFWLFFMLLMMLLPLSRLNAASVYGYGYLPISGQYPGGSYQPLVYPRPVNAHDVRWRPMPPLDRPVATRPMPPVSYTRHQGYQFRPWRRDSRYQPRFPQHRANYQALQYRWRPLIPPHQPGSDYRRNVAGIYQYPAGRYTFVQNTPAFMPGFGQRRVMPPIQFYRNGLRSHQTGNRNAADLTGRVYRSTEITIPNHYVFRPISPKRYEDKRARFADTMQRGFDNHQYRTQNKSVASYNFRPVSVTQQPSHSGSVAAEMVRNTPWRSVTTGRFREVRERLMNPFLVATPDYSRRPVFDSTYPQQYRQMPSANFRYPMSMQGRPRMVSNLSEGYLPYPGPYHGYMDYSANRSQMGIQAPSREHANSYDGQPDSEGSWYNAGKSSGWPMVSQTAETVFPLLESDGTSF